MAVVEADIERIFSDPELDDSDVNWNDLIPPCERCRKLVEKGEKEETNPAEFVVCITLHNCPQDLKRYLLCQECIDSAVGKCGICKKGPLFYEVVSPL